jgi:hypothetical protein
MPRPAARDPAQTYRPARTPGTSPGTSPGTYQGEQPGRTTGANNRAHPGSITRGEQPGSIPGSIPGRIPGRIPGGIPGRIPGRCRTVAGANTGALPNRCRGAAEPWSAGLEPATGDRQKTARGPLISGHRHRPGNRAARPNFRGPTRCGTSACAMFLANNYVKNGISLDLLVN